jgi:hypothetical protein
MLEYLQLQYVGPAPEMTIDLASRLNFITGDNGLGKTFLPNVPVFVLEYLLGKYCASSDEMAIQMGLQVVHDTLANNYIRPDESTRAQSKVKEQDKHTSLTKSRCGSSTHSTGPRSPISATTTYTFPTITCGTSTDC